MNRQRLTLWTGNFGTVFCDNAYYNKAIAASPIHALPGYIMGGLAWFVSLESSSA